MSALLPWLLAASLGLCALGAVAALVAWRRPQLAGALAAACLTLAALAGLVPAFAVLVDGSPLWLRLATPLAYGPVELGLDRLSALFLVPLLVVGAIGAIYGRAYLAHDAGKKALAAPGCFYALLVAAMMLVLLARSALVLLVAWEAMTLSSYLLVTYEHELPDVRRAGWVYLIAGHLGVACLIALFVLLGREAGGLEFARLETMPAPSSLVGVLAVVLALLGFGVKAGLVPLHVWLPEAHAASPSHVSALMSGVLIKMGVYGILRTLGFLTPATWWGPLLIVVGLAGAVVGIALALYQRDLKRVLAYSSIENVGIVMLGVGVGYWGVATHSPSVALLGFAGGLLHVWNHALMKSLMFLGAGSIVHATGTRDLEKMGGLLRRLPRTGPLLVVGAVAIAALPPLAGFVSEWLIYIGLATGGIHQHDVSGVLALLTVGAVALVGGLAALCFVRLIGIALLGTPRSDAAAHAHEPSPWMTGCSAVLALAVAAVGILPHLVLRALGPAAVELAGDAATLDGIRGPLGALATCDVVVWLAIALVAIVFAGLTRGRATVDDTWGCGYLAPTPRLQYTARSFSQLVSAYLLPPLLRPRTHLRPPRDPFPLPAEFSTETPDPVVRAVYEPFFHRWADRLTRLRWVQHGYLHLYLLYILVVIVLAFAWIPLRAWIFG